MKIADDLNKLKIAAIGRINAADYPRNIAAREQVQATYELAEQIAQQNHLLSGIAEILRGRL